MRDIARLSPRDYGQYSFCYATIGSMGTRRRTGIPGAGVLLALGLLATACSERAPVDGQEDATSSASITGDDAPITSDDTTTSHAEPTTAGDSTSDDGEKPFGADFLPSHDAGDDDASCNTLTQNCPAAEKCTHWANDGGSAWNATRCVPIVDDPAHPGEPCTVQGSGVTGLDDCALGSMCFHVDENGTGTCVGFCTGSLDGPFCEDPGQLCSIGGSGMALCVPRCDPLAQDCAHANEVCYPTFGGDWACAPDASGDAGTWGDPCEYVNACDAGTVCIGAQALGDCTGAVGCCAALCDHTDPSSDATCAALDPTMTCEPWYLPGLAPAGHADVGVCRVPA